MPTGLKLNQGFAKMGNINIQAVKAQSEGNNNGNLNVKAAVVAANKIVAQNAGNIAKNANIGQNPIINQFQNLQVALPPLIAKPLQLQAKNINNILIAPIVAQLVVPQKLRGISEQRPEIVSLADFNSIYRSSFGSELSDAGEFIKTSIAARKLRFEHIQALIESIQEVEGANAILEEIAEGYANEVLDAEKTVRLMTKIADIIRDIKRSLNIRNTTALVEEKFRRNIALAPSFKDFLVEEYQFSEAGVVNFSNTKLLGQFFFDVRNTLKQYSPSLFGTNSPQTPNLNADLNFQLNQAAVNNNWLNANFNLGEAEEQTIERNADREFGRYNVDQIDISDGQFKFQVELFRNINFPIVGPAYNGFLDILPGSTADRLALLIMTLSKELRISSGMADEDITDVLFGTFGAGPTGDPFQFVIGRPGATITDPPVGAESLCSLLRFVNDNGDIVLPFESTFVRGDNGRLYIPGTKEIADSILQSEEPYDLTNLRAFQERFSRISSDSITAIAGLLDVGKRTPRLKPVDLFNELSEDFIEAIDLMLSNIGINNNNVVYPPPWGEAALLKLALEDREIKQLLFQYVLALGFVGKPGEIQFGNNSVERFFRNMSTEELTNWGNLPVIAQDRDLNPSTGQRLTSALQSLGLLEEDADLPSIDTGDIANVQTTDSITGYTVLAFIAQTIIQKAKQKGNQDQVDQGGENQDQVFKASVILSDFLGSLIRTRELVFLNRIVDFIATIADRAQNFTADGRTRFNRLNFTTVAAFAFEAFLSFVEQPLSGISLPNTTDEFIIISFNLDEINRNRTIVNLLLRNFGSPKASPSNQAQTIAFAALQSTALSTPLGGVKRKLEKEERLTTQIITRLRRTFSLIDNTTNDAIDFLNLEGPRASQLNELVDAQGGKERLAMIDEPQFILSRKALNDFNEGEGLSLVTRHTIKFKGANRPQRGIKFRIRGKNQFDFSIFKRIRVKRIDIPVFIDGSVISENEKKLMEILLRRPKFRGRRAENLKILTVGIPAGFSNCLSTAINVNEDNADEVLDKERDVVAINVYRRSVEFEDIVFKPQTFLFELSRFVTRPQVNAQEINANRFKDFVNDQSIEFMRDFSRRARGDLQNQEAFLNNEEYDFLSKNQKKSLVSNHIESFVLGLYTQLLTGISTDENDYLVDESLLEGFVDDEAKERFNDLVLTYVRGITQLPITLEQLKESSPQIKALLNKIDTFALETNFTDQITPPVLPGVGIDQRIELTEDLVNFVKLFTPKSLLTGGSVQALRITSPKLFERIFNIAVDPDDFEIDLDKTLETTAGTNMYAILEKQGLLATPTKIRERSKNRTISLDQFFVSVSTVGGSE